MAQPSEELVLLERVFFRIGSADTDEQLQNVLCKFLPPVLLKLSSPHETVRKKVMELLIHVNKRIKTRPLVQLPVEALLAQYQDPSATSFVINFTIIYIKSGFPRLPVEKQAELVPAVINALENKPSSHMDSLLLLILPIIGKVKLPTEPEKIATLFNLNEKPQLSKHLLEMMLDMLLLPYGALTSQTDEEGNTVNIPIPPGLNKPSFLRITQNNPMKPEDLEKIKLEIVKFISHGMFHNDDILIHLIVAAADTRFSVANLADNELKKIIGIVCDSPNTSPPLYKLFLGSGVKVTNPDLKKAPASTRIRLKILTYLCRVTSKGFVYGGAILIVFDALYGTNTNTRLKTLGLNFAANIIRYSTLDQLSKGTPILLPGLKKQIRVGEEAHQGQAYILIGLLAQRVPKCVFHNIETLETFFSNLGTANPELRLQIREGLLNLIHAYKYDIFPEEADENGRLDLLFALIKTKLTSEEPMVRFAAVRTLATIFPPSHVPSKFLLLLATGDLKDDVSAEAFKSLYGTARKNDINLNESGSKIIMPSFEEITKYVFSEAEINIKDPKKLFTVANHELAFNTRTFTEILLYLRLCLIKDLKVPLSRDTLKHPCEFTPIIRNHLLEVGQSNCLIQYAGLVKQLLIATSSSEALCCMIELIGCIPSLNSFNDKETQWIKDQLSSSKEEVRELIASLYGLVLTTSTDKDFEAAVKVLIAQTQHKTLEYQHGALLAIGNCLELKISKKIEANENVLNWDLFKTAVKCLVQFLKHQNGLLLGAACTSLGLLGRVSELPLTDGKASATGSPNAKRPANDNITKFDIVSQLLDIMNDPKASVKVREKAAKSLGLLCVGERFPHTREVLEGLVNTAKETKDIEVHFTIGEALVMACQSIWSPEARNPWAVLPKDYSPSMGDQSNDDLNWLLTELLNLSKHPHPNSRQACCIWLLAIVKGCGEREPITEKLQVIQNAFMDFLCENNDIVQDAASKGLCVVYDTYKSEDLLAALVKQLTTGTSRVQEVTSDTKLFEEGQLGKAPTGGNLTTYKELCSLASDLNKPDLIYRFMHLANHNAVWNSKKGAAFGFSSIAERCGEDLKAHLPEIVPKLYRYQYDPNGNIQASMHNIWRSLVQEPQKILDQYYDEILKDLLANLNSNQYRVRQSCCLALQDFLKGSGNRSIHDAVDSMDELWSKLFRVMDDHHEETRQTAVRTCRVLSTLCIRGCDVSQGKAGVRMVEAILPSLLNTGITNSVLEIRSISLQTVGELVNSAGKQLKPFLPKLIPALLQATGDLESTKLSYLSNRYGANSEVQEAVDSARASIAKSHFTTETVSKSLQFADASILEELVPKVIELMKGIGLGVRVACAHFIVMLVVQLGKDIQPYTGKFLAALVNGLTDRNAAVRKHYASSIGHLVSTAKDSSLEKLFEKLRHWYFEREDDSIRSACAHTIQSIGIHNQEVLKNFANVVLPLVFFAMHAEKSQENEATLEIWTEIWSEQSPGTETGIRQNIENICDMLKTALESPSWTMKAQAANAVSTVALKLGSSLDVKHRNMLISILLNGLQGRTWNGKDKLLKALASICSSCKEGLKEDKEVDKEAIVQAVLKESRKEEIVYKNSALQALGNIIAALEVDKFEEVYQIIQIILGDQSLTKMDEDASSEEISKNRENIIKLTETAYDTLGKTWPETKQTQEKYREIIVEQSVKCLPTITRSIQVSVMAALYNFVDKLLLLKEDNLTPEESKSLRTIVDNIIIAVKYSLSIAKHTRLRKESLNVILSLSQKLNEKKNKEEFEKLSCMFRDVLGDMEKDNQPEIKSRVKDIKTLLCAE